MGKQVQNRLRVFENRVLGEGIRAEEGRGDRGLEEIT
jgi:hypothetical protein